VQPGLSEVPSRASLTFHFEWESGDEVGFEGLNLLLSLLTGYRTGSAGMPCVPADPDRTQARSVPINESLS
jgi:hypothetical protein